MAQPWIEALRHAAAGLGHGAIEVAACAVVFGAVALAAKGRAAFAGLRTLAGEVRTSAAFAVCNRLVVNPTLSLCAAFVGVRLREHLPHLPDFHLPLGDWPTLFAVVVAGDFVGYWRHRLQHSRWLWPAHAVHHGDRRLCWFSLERMHPLDELWLLIDMTVLGLIGFPFWALAANTIVRHFWGYFIHCDLPWTLGKAGLVMCSPVMHRWHHAREIEGFGCNFATMFSVFDRAFGTYYAPHPRPVVGLDEDLGQGAAAQFAHPFRVWRRALAGSRDAAATDASPA
jgi:sterol desaturase/sphingolipid hydroxylase (fatty acid hydroxylase superfamily)